MKESQRIWIGLATLAVGIVCLAAAVVVKYPVAGLGADPQDPPRRQVNDVYLTQQGTTACDVERPKGGGMLFSAKFTEVPLNLPADGGKPACPT
jgi:hypothetical protein